MNGGDELRARLLDDLAGRVRAARADTARIVAATEGLAAREARRPIAELAAVLDAQQATLEDLRTRLRDAAPAERAAATRAVLEGLTTSARLRELLRAIASQYAAPDLAPALRVALHVAAHAYRHATDASAPRAVVGLPASPRLTPPLVYLAGVAAPVASARGAGFADLVAEGPRFVRLRLPVPVVRLPLDDAGRVAPLCALFHEVGHVVCADHGLVAEVEQAACLERVVPVEAFAAWGPWLDEVVADAFGVLLGGLAYVSSVAPLLLALEGAQDAPGGGRYPPPATRLRLLVELAREVGAGLWTPQLDALDATLATLPTKAHDGEAGALGRKLVALRLPALEGRELRALGLDWMRWDAYVEALTRHLRTDAPAPPAGDFRGCHGLVAVAAQLARAGAPSGDEAAHDAIERRALAFAARVEPFEPLSAPALPPRGHRHA